MTVGEVPTAKRKEMADWLTARGYDTGWIKVSTTLGEVFKDLVDYINLRRKHNPNYLTWINDVLGITDLETTVGSIPVADRDKIAAWMDRRGLDYTWVTGTTTIQQVLTFVSYKALPGDAIPEKLMAWCKQFIN